MIQVLKASKCGRGVRKKYILSQKRGAVTFRLFFLLVTMLLFEGAVVDDCMATQEMVITYRAAESKSDLRYDYDTRLLRLALENTLATDGPYKLVASPVMNFSRAIHLAKVNALPNFFIKLSYEKQYNEQGMAFVPFPVDLGIVGYRVCFAHPEVAEQLSRVESLEELRRFSHGQGRGWSDVAILRLNGMEVFEVSKYESLFSMVAARRFDLFCRGTNELLGELNMHEHINGLTYDKSVTISYPLPRFFYTTSANSKALDRIRRGILIAYENGSLQALWYDHYKESIDFVQLHKRKVFPLENPLVKDIDFDYQRYFYNPFKKSH